MWWFPLAAAAPVVLVVGDDLQLVDHFPALSRALPGAVRYGTVRDGGATTTLTVPAGVDPAPYLAALPPGAVVTEAARGESRVVVTLGDDLDAAAGPGDDPDLQAITSVTYWGSPLAFTVLGFEGPALVLELHTAGCCDAPPDDERTVWYVDPGVRRDGYTTDLALTEEQLGLLLGVIPQAPHGPPPFTGPWRPTGRAPALQARRAARPVTPAVTGPIGPRASVEVSMRGAALTPQVDGWAIEPPAGADGRGAAWLEVTVHPAAGPPRHLRVDLGAMLSADGMFGGPIGHLYPVWSAVGDVGVLVVESPMRMAHHAITVLALPVAGPGVEVVGGEGVAAAIEAVRGAGLRVVHTGPSAAPHAALEVFYRPDFEVDARVLAATLGASRIAPMDWAGAGDLVVATP